MKVRDILVETVTAAGGTILNPSRQSGPGIWILEAYFTAIGVCTISYDGSFYWLALPSANGVGEAIAYCNHLGFLLASARRHIEKSKGN